MIPLENLDATKIKGSTTPVTAGSLPGILPGVAKDSWDPDKYSIRYRKFNLDDIADITELEQIETRAVRNKGVYILTKKDFFFMDKIFMLVSYLEEDSKPSNAPADTPSPFPPF